MRDERRKFACAHCGADITIPAAFGGTAPDCGGSCPTCKQSLCRTCSGGWCDPPRKVNIYAQGPSGQCEIAYSADTAEEATEECERLNIEECEETGGGSGWYYTTESEVSDEG